MQNLSLGNNDANKSNNHPHKLHMGDGELCQSVNGAGGTWFWCSGAAISLIPPSIHVRTKLGIIATQAEPITPGAMGSTMVADEILGATRCREAWWKRDFSKLYHALPHLGEEVTHVMRKCAYNPMKCLSLNWTTRPTFWRIRAKVLFTFKNSCEFLKREWGKSTPTR